MFMRGGTANAVVFHQKDLPADRLLWDAIFLAAIGSPDPYGRQLDGMGGGFTAVSKVCVIGPPTRDDADIDYTFAQIPVKEQRVEYAANCGNMSAAMGPFAVDEGLVPVPDANGDALVRPKCVCVKASGWPSAARFCARNGACLKAACWCVSRMLVCRNSLTITI